MKTLDKEQLEAVQESFKGLFTHNSVKEILAEKGLIQEDFVKGQWIKRVWYDGDVDFFQLKKQVKNKLHTEILYRNGKLLIKDTLHIIDFHRATFKLTSATTEEVEALQPKFVKGQLYKSGIGTLIVYNGNNTGYGFFSNNIYAARYDISRIKLWSLATREDEEKFGKLLIEEAKRRGFLTGRQFTHNKEQ